MFGYHTIFKELWLLRQKLVVRQKQRFVFKLWQQTRTLIGSQAQVSPYIDGERHQWFHINVKPLLRYIRDGIWFIQYDFCWIIRLKNNLSTISEFSKFDFLYISKYKISISELICNRMKLELIQVITWDIKISRDMIMWWFNSPSKLKF